MGGSGGSAGERPVRAKGDGRSGGAEAPDRRTVWTLRDGRPAPVKVKTGISDGSFTEVVDGALEAGDLVVTDAVGPPSGMAAAMRRGL